MPDPLPVGNDVAALYQCLWQEPLIERAIGFARRIAEHPRPALQLPPPMLDAARQLRHDLGDKPHLPGASERAAIYRAVFGRELLAAGAALRRAALHEMLASHGARSALSAASADAVLAMRARLAGLAAASAAMAPLVRNVRDLSLSLLSTTDAPDARGDPGGGPQAVAYNGRSIDSAPMRAFARLGQAGAATLAALGEGSPPAEVLRRAYGWNRALADVAALRRQARIAVGGTGGFPWPWRKCLFWICDDYLVCGFLPGRIWPTCFYATLCYCAIYEA